MNGFPYINCQSIYKIKNNLITGIVLRPTMLKVNEDVELILEQLISLELN
jgi:hypothetical protein